MCVSQLPTTSNSEVIGTELPFTGPTQPSAGALPILSPVCFILHDFLDSSHFCGQHSRPHLHPRLQSPHLIGLGCRKGITITEGDNETSKGRIPFLSTWTAIQA